MRTTRTSWAATPIRLAIAVALTLLLACSLTGSARAEGIDIARTESRLEMISSCAALGGDYTDLGDGAYGVCVLPSGFVEVCNFATLDCIYFLSTHPGSGAHANTNSGGVVNGDLGGPANPTPVTVTVTGGSRSAGGTTGSRRHTVGANTADNPGAAAVETTVAQDADTIAATTATPDAGSGSKPRDEQP